MAYANWLCTKSSKNMFLKIVLPGGHVELHDRPILAAEIMLQNPKCYVAHPHVFQQPWATVEPETMLMLGQKFYVVPINTIRKLQHFSLKYSPVHHLPITGSSTIRQESDRESSVDSSDQKDHVDQKEGMLCDVKYCFFRVLKVRGRKNDDGLIKESRRSANETETLTRKRTFINFSSRNGIRRSYKRFASLDQYWQPSLESISED